MTAALLLVSAVAQAQSVGISANHTSPQQVGTATTWTATPTNPIAPYVYYFTWTDGNTWYYSSGYTNNNQWSYTFQQPGTYRVCVELVGWDEGIGDYYSEASACSTNYVVVTSMTVTGVSIWANKTSPQIVGTAITFVATPTAGTGLAPFSYKWSLSSDNGATWSTLQDWTANANQYVWTPQTVSSSWRIKAAVRSTGSTNANGEANNSMTYASSPTPWVTAVSLAADRTSPQNTATTITWTATPTYGTPPVYYFWQIVRNGVNFAQRDWYPDVHYIWTPQQSGTYKFCVYAIGADGDPEYPEASTCSADFVINNSPTVTSVSLTPNLSSPRAAGELIWWTATPSWGTAPISYQWSLSTDSGATWSVLQDWTANASMYAWRPLEVRNTWRIKAAARSAGSTSSTGEANAVANFVTVASPEVTYVTVTSSASPGFVGNPITLTAHPTGGSPPLYYYWQMWRDGSYVAYSDWSTSPQLTYTPQSIGVWTFSVWVMSDGGDPAGEGEAQTGLVVPVAPVPPADAFIYDSFTVSNGTTLSGRKPELSPAGTSWLVAGSPTPSVQSYQASITSGSGWVLATVNSGLANAVVGADVIPGNATGWGGVALRLTDANNFLFVAYRGSSNELVLSQVQNGAMTDLATGPALASVGERHRIDVRLEVNRIEAYWDGYFRFAYTTSFQQNVTRHGLVWSPSLDANTKLDSFEVSGAPIISGPPNQTNEIATTIVPVQIAAIDLGGLPLTYGATGLPSGLSVNASTGVISGAITAAAGAYTVTLSASNGTFVGYRTLKWTALPHPPAAPPNARVFDTFTGNGSATPLNARIPAGSWQHAPWFVLDGPSPWVDAGEVAGVGTTSSGYVVAVIDSGTADGMVSVDFRSTAANRRAGVILRMADVQNFLVLQYTGNWSSGRVELLQRVHGVFTSLKGASVGPLDGPHTLAARIVNGSVTGLLDGRALFETTANNNSWGTWHGLLWTTSADTTTAFDNFTVTSDFGPQLLPWNTTCEASLSRLVASVPRSGNNTVQVDVSIPADCQWTASSRSGWIGLIGDYYPNFPKRGPSSAQFNIADRSDNEHNPRVGYAIVAGKAVTIVQAGLDVGECQYGLYTDPTHAFPIDRIQANADGGSWTIYVSPTYPTCTWVVTPDYRHVEGTDAGWISISDGSVRSGEGSFTVSFGRNPNALASRSAYLNIGTRGEFSVEQSSEQCSFALDRTSITLPADGDLTFDTYVTAPHECGWEVVAGANWLDINEHQQGNGDMSFRTSAQNNPAGNPARMTIIELRHGNIARATMTVLQCPVGAGLNCALDPGGEVSYFHTDALGSVRLITNASGTEVASFDYLPFGQELGQQTLGTQNVVGFTGKERDKETEIPGSWLPLDYFGARYYQSQSGRFTGVDPVLDLDKAIVDPQRWNRYTYVRNNPLRYVDPDGRVIDTILDVAFTAYDLFDVGRSIYRGQGVSAVQVGALAADVASIFVPFATGGGAAVRAGVRAGEVATASRTAGRVALDANAIITRLEKSPSEVQRVVTAIAGRETSVSITAVKEFLKGGGSVDALRAFLKETGGRVGKAPSKELLKQLEEMGLKPADARIVGSAMEEGIKLLTTDKGILKKVPYIAEPF